MQEKGGIVATRVVFVLRKGTLHLPSVDLSDGNSEEVVIAPNQTRTVTNVESRN